jgi:hypothetical protein
MRGVMTGVGPVIHDNALAVRLCFRGHPARRERESASAERLRIMADLAGGHCGAGIAGEGEGRAGLGAGVEYASVPRSEDPRLLSPRALGSTL